MALGDALAVCLMKKKNFKKEDFASFHPGGTLGKQLFVKVKDLLQKENLPIVSRETSLKDAIVIMSEGRLGNAIVMENNKIVGLLSDGDLRRAMLDKNFSLNCKTASNFIISLHKNYLFERVCYYFLLFKYSSQSFKNLSKPMSVNG
jgi:signal-transduction protein with cAMP-binding, CBS, and nucleotidyltransferase domain